MTTGARVHRGKADVLAIIAKAVALAAIREPGFLRVRLVKNHERLQPF